MPPLFFAAALPGNSAVPGRLVRVALRFRQRTHDQHHLRFDSDELGKFREWISAWNYAAGVIQSQYSDPITINITFAAGGGLGSSNTNLQFIGGADDYATMKAALIADATTANDATANANLPAVDPTGGNRFFIASFAEAKALGLRAANDGATDGTITLGTGNTYTFDPNNRAVAGAYDFIGVAEHEISEVMGRIGILGNDLGTGFPLDDAHRPVRL